MQTFAHLDRLNFPGRLAKDERYARATRVQRGRSVAGGAVEVGEGAPEGVLADARADAGQIVHSGLLSSL